MHKRSKPVWVLSREPVHYARVHPRRCITFTHRLLVVRLRLLYTFWMSSCRQVFVMSLKSFKCTLLYFWLTSSRWVLCDNFLWIFFEIYHYCILFILLEGHSWQCRSRRTVRAFWTTCFKNLQSVLMYDQ